MNIQSQRIPAALQSVFLASNSGLDVHSPPPERVASKLFAIPQGRSHEPSCSHDRDASMRASVDTDGMGKSMQPQAYLDLILRSRGYSTKRYETRKTAYANKPTALQQASYDLFLIGLLRSRNLDVFRKVMSCGISPNPCNLHGESLVHMVCRRGEHEFLQVLVQNGCSFQVADDYGRNPLHDACWAARPAFETVKILLEGDRRLLHLIDCRGHVPLNYVRKEHWTAWIDFIDTNKDTFWPQLSEEELPPPLTLQGANTHPLCDPSNALTVELASMVSSGRMKPSEAVLLHREEDPTEDMTEEDSIYSDSDSEYDSDYFSDEDDDDDSIMDDISGLLNSFHTSCVTRASR